MNFISHIFKKHKIPAFSVLGFLVISVIYLAQNSFAGFAPGTTLDPGCMPGSLGCIVDFTNSKFF